MTAGISSTVCSRDFGARCQCSAQNDMKFNETRKNVFISVAFIVIQHIICWSFVHRLKVKSLRAEMICSLPLNILIISNFLLGSRCAEVLFVVGEKKEDIFFIFPSKVCYAPAPVFGVSCRKARRSFKPNLLLYNIINSKNLITHIYLRSFATKYILPSEGFGVLYEYHDRQK